MSSLVLGSHSWAASVGEFYRPFYIPGHTACRLCEAKGLSECEVLGDISDVPKEHAMHHAAQNFGVNTIIDSSKKIEWVETFRNRTDIEVFVIHLIRHPCGYVASRLRRRDSETPEEALYEWATRNQEIRDFALGFGENAITMSYESLALDTENSFTELTRFIGGKFENQALRYWEFEHHGLGGNGANFAYLKKLPNAVFVTGDQKYYEGISGREHVYDERWRSELDAAVISACASSSLTSKIASFIGEDYEWTV